MVIEEVLCVIVHNEHISCNESSESIGTAAPQKRQEHLGLNLQTQILEDPT